MADPTYRMSMLPFGTYANPDGTESLGWAMPGMIQEPINALMRLAENSRLPDGRLGVPNPDNAQNRDDVLTGLLSMYGGNAMNPAAALPKNAVGMLAGRMAKTADHAALARAEDLAAQGAPREQIWNETGWFQGPDQKWRFEVDDSRAFVKGAGAKNAQQVSDQFGGTVGSALFHPDLHAAYPHFSDVAFTGKEGRGGYYQRSPLYGDEIGIGNDYRGSQTGNVLLHEVQHGVQYHEGFANGANSGDFTYQNSPLFTERRSYESPADTYKRVAGEVEARNVQKRADMTAEERRATPPWLTQDVPDADQIVRILSDTGKPSLMESALAGAEAPQRMYHGTATADDFSHFIPSKNGAFGPGVYLSREAESTNPYAFNGPNPRVMPVDVSGPLATYDDYLAARNASPDPAATIQSLLDKGFSGVSVDNATPKGSVNVTNVFRPGSVRSATTGETLFSDTGKPSLFGSAVAGAEANKPMRAYRGYGGRSEDEAFLYPERDMLFASSDPHTAATYANSAPNGDPVLSRYGISTQGAVAPLEMNFENPLRVDAQGSVWDQIPFNGKSWSTTDEIANLARERGHDGLILDNVRDGIGTAGNYLPPASTYVALKRGTVTSPLTGETLFSDGLPSIWGNALAPYQDEPRNALLNY